MKVEDRSRPPHQVATFFRYRLPALLWTALILAASTSMMAAPTTFGMTAVIDRVLELGLSYEQLTIFNWVIRKTAHVVCYGIEGLLVLRAIRGGRAGREWRWVGWTLGLTLLVALLDEGNQSLTPTRTGAVDDVAIDMIGAVLAVTVFGRGRRRN